MRDGSRRWAPAILLVLAACALASIFAIHHLEQAGSPVGRPTVSRAFSPNADHSNDSASLEFRLAHPAAVTAWIVDDMGRHVRALVSNARRNGVVRLEWDGSASSGRLAPAGTYHLLIQLGRRHPRRFDVRSPIVLDVTPPRIAAVHLDLHNVSRYGIVRVFATTDRNLRSRELELHGKPLVTGHVGADSIGPAGSYSTYSISARLPAGTTPGEARGVRLVVVDAAGNRSSSSGVAPASPTGLPTPGVTRTAPRSPARPSGATDTAPRISSHLRLLTILASVLAIVGMLGALYSRRWFRPCLLLLAAGLAGELSAVLPSALRAHASLLVVACVVGLLVAWGIARLARGRDSWLWVAIAVALPLRVQLPVGGESFDLLVPLYALLAIATLRLLLAVGPRGLDLPTDRGGRAIDATVAGITVISCASLWWSIDGRHTAEKLALVYLPFAVLYVAVRSWPGRPALRAPAVAFVTTMVAAALIGSWQHHQRVVWQNQKLRIANTYTPDFRTNSIFWDPNAYGRYLAVGILVLATWFVFHRIRGRLRLAGGIAAAVLVVALWHTYSQSSFLALAAGLTACALVMMDRPWRIAAGALVVVALAASPLAVHALRGSDVTSRAGLARTGIELARSHPVVGLGVGGFERGVIDLTRERHRRHLPSLRISHATPITVAAELGIVGLAVYLALLAAAAVASFRHEAPARVSSARAGPGAPIMWASACLAAIVAHSMLYAGFFEDPLTWFALALLASPAGPSPADPSQDGLHPAPRQS